MAQGVFRSYMTKLWTCLCPYHGMVGEVYLPLPPPQGLWLSSIARHEVSFSRIKVVNRFLNEVRRENKVPRALQEAISLVLFLFGSNLKPLFVDFELLKASLGPQ